MTIQRIFFYLFLISIPFGTRVLLFQFTPGFHEYETAFLYLSDITLILFLASSSITSPKRIFRGKSEILNPKSESNSNFQISKSKTPVTGYWLLVTFLFFALLSIFFAASPGLAIYKFVRLLLLVLMAFAAADLLRDEKVFKTTLAIIAILATIQSLIGFSQFVHQENLGLQILGESPIGATDSGTSKIQVEGGKAVRAYGTFPHPNILATFLLLGLFSMFYFWIKTEPNDANIIRMIRITLSSLGIFFVILGLILTFSRTAWVIGILLTLAFLIYAIIRRDFRHHGFRLAAVLVTSYLLLITILNAFVAPRVQLSLTEPAVSQRFTYNDLAIDLIKENPLGVGIGTQVLYSVENGVYQQFGMDRVWQWQPIHNLYFLVASEIGVFGLFSFLIFLAMLLISNFPDCAPRAVRQFPISRKFSNSDYRNSPNLALVTSYLLLVALLLFGFFDHFFWTIWPGQIMLWLAIGVIMSRKLIEIVEIDGN